MAKTIKRISDFAKLEDVRPPALKPEQFLGVELVLTAVDWAQGTFGDFAVMTVYRYDDTEQKPFNITCGGAIVVKQLSAAIEVGLPVAIKFGKSGRSVYME